MNTKLRNALTTTINWHGWRRLEDGCLHHSVFVYITTATRYLIIMYFYFMHIKSGAEVINGSHTITHVGDLSITF